LEKAFQFFDSQQWKRLFIKIVVFCCLLFFSCLVGSNRHPVGSIAIVI